MSRTEQIQSVLLIDAMLCAILGAILLSPGRPVGERFLGVCWYAVALGLFITLVVMAIA